MILDCSWFIGFWTRAFLIFYGLILFYLSFEFSYNFTPLRSSPFVPRTVPFFTNFLLKVNWGQSYVCLSVVETCAETATVAMFLLWGYCGSFYKLPTWLCLSSFTSESYRFCAQTMLIVFLFIIFFSHFLSDYSY